MGNILHGQPSVQVILQSKIIFHILKDLLTAFLQLNNVPLSKNVVRAIDAQKELPEFRLFPAAHRVTYKYYVGVLSFLQEDYAKVSTLHLVDRVVNLT